MSIIKNIIGRVFATWALIVFVVTMIPAFLIILCVNLWKEPKRSQKFRIITQVWMRLFFFLTGIRIEIKGKEYFDKNKTYVIICNHRSFMDVPMTTPFLPAANKTIAKKEMAAIPVFGTIYKMGSVLVDRKSEESRRRSFDDMKKVLAMRLNMCIYPEGTRNKTNEPLRPFHNGAFRLAKETGNPILPIAMFNTAKVLPANKTFFFWPVKIRMHILPAIDPSTLSMDELKTEAFERMKAEIEKGM